MKIIVLLLLGLATVTSMFRILSKKRLAVLGSGAVAGLIIVTKILPISSSTSRCLASCTTDSLAYHRLQANEIELKFHHPRIKSVYINNLPSNTPGEDRHVAGGWSQHSTGLFGVIDGHKTAHCSEHLKNTLLKHVTSVFIEEKLITDGTKMDEYNTTQFAPPSHKDTQSGSVINLTSDTLTLSENVEETLKKSFVSLDNKISEEALQCVRRIGQGASIKKDNMLETIMKGLAGACTLLSLVSAQDIYIASTGDCRAVLATKHNKLLAIPLSIDQNAQNEFEVNRVKRDHPGEDKTIIMNDRLLGGLMPFRSFGDCDYKWAREDIQIVEGLLPYYKTPPYLTAEPVVTRHKIDGNEKFLILATDGLWDKLHNEDAVNIVLSSLYGDKTIFSSLFGQKSQDCCENPATNLLWEALGGEETEVTNMLELPRQHSRMYRDDITIIVIEFK